MQGVAPYLRTLEGEGQPSCRMGLHSSLRRGKAVSSRKVKPLTSRRGGRDWGQVFKPTKRFIVRHLEWSPKCQTRRPLLLGQFRLRVYLDHDGCMATSLKRLAKLCRSASPAQGAELRALLQQLPAARLELNGSGDTPLHLSCRHDGLLAAQLTLAVHPQSLEKRNKVGHTALHEACLSTSTAIVTLLLEHNLDVDRTKHGSTLCQTACILKHIVLINTPCHRSRLDSPAPGCHQASGAANHCGGVARSTSAV